MNASITLLGLLRTLHCFKLNGSLINEKNVEIIKFKNCTTLKCIFFINILMNSIKFPLFKVLIFFKITNDSFKLHDNLNKKTEDKSSTHLDEESI